MAVEISGSVQDSGHLSALLNATDQGMWSLGLDGRCTFMNRAGAAMLGYDAEQLIGQDVHRLVHQHAPTGPVSDDDACPLLAVLRTGQGVQVVEEPLRRADGTTITADCSAFPLTNHGVVVGAVITFRDVGHRQRLLRDYAELLAREQLARSSAEAAQRRWAFLASASNLLASSLDYETTLQTVARLAVPEFADWCVVDTLDEQGAPRLLAVAHVEPAKEALVRELRALYPPDPRAAHGLPKVLRDGAAELYPWVDPAWRRAAARDAHHLELMDALGTSSSMCVPLRARGQTLGALTFVWSVSQRAYGTEDVAFAEEIGRRCALALDNARLYGQMQDALRTREAFLASVAHDLKNPLTTVKAYAQMLQRRSSQVADTQVRDPIVDWSRKIDASASTMTEILDELLDVARLQIGRSLELQRRPTDLVALVERVLNDQQQVTQQHELVLKTSSTSLMGLWDPARIERVLRNLVSNAIKYSPDGGDITVTLSQEHGWARVAVRDTGIGIPAADLPHVFEQFRRASNAVGRVVGTGLGLAGSRQIVEQHGGMISVESVEGQGSTFILSLPLGDAP